MSEVKNSNYKIIIPSVLCFGLAAGLLIGATFGGSRTLAGKANSGMQKIQEVLRIVKNEYVDDVKTDVLVDDAIHHILAKLDPHSTYISAKDREEANEDLRGNYEGIGIEFGIFHDTLVVVSPLAGGPSEAVGLHPGDQIIKVDTTIIAGVKISNADVMRHLKGPKGTDVKIEVIRKNIRNPLFFTITRDKIPQFSVDASYMIDSQIGYIKISRFAQTTFEEFQAALKKLKDKGMKKLIVDLQGNPGGYMNQAIDLADEFLPAGEKILTTKGKDRTFNKVEMSTGKGEFEKGDLIILVNEGSASASEILAGALQDNDRALIVGRRSFGKGLVQSPFDLSDGSELRLVISRYYTPSGRSIQKPYGKETDYSKDMMRRYKHGEFFTADSVKFNDSLKFKTTSGRTVYGGGGIMPDYFVPLDTAMNSHYLNELYYSNSMQEYTFKYAEEHKPELEKMGYDNFFSNFKVTDLMLSDLVAVGKRNKVTPDYKDLTKNKKAFQINAKAQIARKIWMSNGFYPIFNETNEVLQQAVKMFDRIPEINRHHL
jgi:carboxyl-terminal processing protease